MISDPINIPPSMRLTFKLIGRIQVQYIFITLFTDLTNAKQINFGNSFYSCSDPNEF